MHVTDYMQWTWGKIKHSPIMEKNIDSTVHVMRTRYQSCNIYCTSLHCSTV